MHNRRSNACINLIKLFETFYDYSPGTQQFGKMCVRQSNKTSSNYLVLITLLAQDINFIVAKMRACEQVRVLRVISQYHVSVNGHIFVCMYVCIHIYIAI